MTYTETIEVKVRAKNHTDAMNKFRQIQNLLIFNAKVAGYKIVNKGKKDEQD